MQHIDPSAYKWVNLIDLSLIMFLIWIFFTGTLQKEREAVNGILETTKAQTMFLESLQKDHSTQSGAIQQKAHDTFQQKYMVRRHMINLSIVTHSFMILFFWVQDYEPSGNTPVRLDTHVPSKMSIESLRAMPMETLLEEFRENHSFESFEAKEAKISPTYRSPFAEIN